MADQQEMPQDADVQQDFQGQDMGDLQEQAVAGGETYQTAEPVVSQVLPGTYLGGYGGYGVSRIGGYAGYGGVTRLGGVYPGVQQPYMLGSVRGLPPQYGFPAIQQPAFAPRFVNAAPAVVAPAPVRYMGNVAPARYTSAPISAPIYGGGFAGGFYGGYAGPVVRGGFVPSTGRVYSTPMAPSYSAYAVNGAAQQQEPEGLQEQAPAAPNAA